MTIGIIGAGSIGQAIARRLATSGIDAVISNSRGPQSLAALVRQLGPHITAATSVEAAQAEMVVVAVPWSRLPEALSGLPAWAGRIVIDATNPLLPPNFQMAELHGRTSSEVVAELVEGARLVKAFNTLPPRLLEADPHVTFAGGTGRRVILYAGDDSSAKAQVGNLLEQLGFAGIDLGGLIEGGKLQQFPGGPLPALNLVLLR